MTKTKRWNAAEIRARIDEVLPPGRVIPRHTAKEHWYEVREGDLINAPVFKEDGVTPNIVGPLYASVTGKLQILKDEGLINYKMDRAIEHMRNFVYGNFKALAVAEEGVVMQMIDDACIAAGNVSQEILVDAGDVGTRVHNTRERIFNHWIKTGVRPADFLTFIDPSEVDVRVTSCIRALQKFVMERDYTPVRCELLVYSHKLRVAGTLDDLGLMRQELRPGSKDCNHTSRMFFDGAESGMTKMSAIMEGENGKFTCMQCGYQYRYEFVLMDIKTSNRFKDHFFFQVALYGRKLLDLMGRAWKTERAIIVKLSKTDGTYQIEDLKRPAKLAQYAGYMLKTNEGVEFIKGLRKDNQKVVIKI